MAWLGQSGAVQDLVARRVRLRNRRKQRQLVDAHDRRPGRRERKAQRACWAAQPREREVRVSLRCPVEGKTERGVCRLNRGDASRERRLRPPGPQPHDPRAAQVRERSHAIEREREARGTNGVERRDHRDHALGRDRAQERDGDVQLLRRFEAPDDARAAKRVDRFRGERADGGGDLDSDEQPQRAFPRGARFYFGGGAIAAGFGPPAYISSETKHVTLGKWPPLTALPPRLLTVSPASSATPRTSSLRSSTMSA